MFLFTTPPSPRETGAQPSAGARAAGPGVVEAIRDGAQASGVGFDYLLATAQRESALDPAAKAGTSSATGLFQFIEQTWLGVMKNAGPKLGLSPYADAITARPDGTYTVDDPAARQTILDLRRDPRISATLAGALTQKNGEALAGALGREPGAGDLYAAHVLGARGAANLIASVRANPDRAAALDLPEAAAANRALFYDRSGRPRTVAELYAGLSAAAQGAQQGSGPRGATVLNAGGNLPPDLPQATTAYAASAYAAGADLRSLFQTDRRPGPVAQGLPKLWQGRPDAAAAGSGSGAAPARTARSWFPRSGAEAEPVAAVAEPEPEPVAAQTTGALAAAVPPGSVILNPPLPPRRPTALAAPTNAFFATRSGP